MARAHAVYGYNLRLLWPTRARFMLPFVYTHQNPEHVSAAAREQCYWVVVRDLNDRHRAAEALLG